MKQQCEVGGEWIYVGSETGATPINIPSGYSEIMVIVQRGGGDITSSWIFPKDFIENRAIQRDQSENFFRAENGAMYNTSSNGAGISVAISKAGDQVWINNVFSSGVDVTSISVIYLYYK